jgi:hypothetical protein
MSDFSLYKRLTTEGTLSEPNGVPYPQFALPATVNWMHALALLVTQNNLDFTSALENYSTITSKKFNVHEENTIFEQLLFALHQLSALETLCSTSCKADVARVGIVAWYYGIYSAASAMVTAQDGSFQDDHTGTANVWDHNFSATNKLIYPFSLGVSSLVENQYKIEIGNLKAPGSFTLNSKPSNIQEAHNACVAYLSGSAVYWKWKAEEKLKKSTDFKKLGVANFRSKAARDMRDKRLSGKSICFLHQAIRYRGKANYREALFLGHGMFVENLLTDYLDDLSIVLRGFVVMSGTFVSKRLGSKLWNDYLGDLDTHKSFTLSPSKLLS